MIKPMPRSSRAASGRKIDIVPRKPRPRHIIDPFARAARCQKHPRDTRRAHGDYGGLNKIRLSRLRRPADTCIARSPEITKGRTILNVGIRHEREGRGRVGAIAVGKRHLTTFRLFDCEILRRHVLPAVTRMTRPPDRVETRFAK